MTERKEGSSVLSADNSRHMDWGRAFRQQYGDPWRMKRERYLWSSGVGDQNDGVNSRGNRRKSVRQSERQPFTEHLAINETKTRGVLEVKMRNQARVLFVDWKSRPYIILIRLI